MKHVLVTNPLQVNTLINMLYNLIDFQTKQEPFFSRQCEEGRYLWTEIERNGGGVCLEERDLQG